MHSDKKITREDTWRPADLRRHIREGGGGDERKHRGGESTERRRREEKESRRERDKQKERESTRERRDEDERDRYADRRKEGSRDRRGDKERDREKRRERDRLVDGKRNDDDYKENRDRRRDKGEKQEGERDKESHRHREKERDGDGERRRKEEREERDKERRREERESERRAERERRRHEVSGEGERDRIERHEREKRERHRERDGRKDEREDKRNDKERRERHGDRKNVELMEEREHKEEHRRRKDEGERRHKDRGYHDEKRKHDTESRAHRDAKASGEDARRHRGDKERGEPDRHKESRHREEEEEEEEEEERNHHRDRTSSKKSASDKSHQQETKTEDAATVSEQQTTSVKDVGDTEEPVVDDEDLADPEYEDDFEDYEEDFEEMDESANEGEDEKEERRSEAGEELEGLTAQRRKEIEAIQRAMNEENERVGTAQSRQSGSREEEEEDGPKWSRGSEKNQSRASQRGKFIDFVAAKQREVSKKVATKQKKRSTELLRLIDLDFSMTYSILDLPPVNEYEMYIRSFGAANTKQAYVQCNEDNADRDIQTEEIEMCEKWTQHPPEHKGACGDPNLSQEAGDKTTNATNFDSKHLTAFLRSASQVMVVLLEEDRAESKSLRKLRSQTDTLSFSDGSLQLNTKLPFLYGRSVSLVHFSQVQRHTMMSVHGPTTKPSAVRLDSCTIICIWNIWEPSRPQKVLVYESEVQCCCFSPGKSILVFAGTSVGSVVLWDLREHVGNHYRLKIGEDEWTLRQPTFSTDAVMAGSGHFSCVTSVEVVPSAVAGGLQSEVPLLASEEESSGLSFQLASLDESGVLNFWNNRRRVTVVWPDDLALLINRVSKCSRSNGNTQLMEAVEVVVELPKANEAGSPTDLGLRPGGKVKLLHSSSLLTAERVSPRDAAKSGPSQTLHLKFLPTDSNHFFIGTNMGLVNHGTSHGLKAPPKFYRFQEAGIRPVDVSAIHFSPFVQHMFLVGCGDGSIRLHTVSQEQPVAEWKNSTAGEPVASLQWTQTRPAVFCVLDGASNLHIWDLLKNDTEPVVTERIHSDRPTAMAAFGDSAQQNTYSGIALARESGTIEMHYFTRGFTAPVPEEEEKLERMVTEAF